MTEIVRATDRETALTRVRELADEVTVVWPGAMLAEVVELLQTEVRIAGVVDGAPIPEVADDGVEHTIRDAREAAACVRSLGAYLAARGVRENLATSVEQVADELVTNALFDAPVDVDGKQLFEGMAPRRRARFHTDRSVRLRCRAAGAHVTLVVSDGFGSLRRATVLRTLYKCIHTERPVDNRTEGAGVGMYLALRAATSLRCEIRPHHSTEITATFEDGATRTQLVFVTHPTVAAPSPARLRRIPNPRVTRAVAFALPLITIVVALLVPSPAVPVTITSDPPGALVDVDGRVLGTTPMRRALDFSRARIGFALPGYAPAYVDAVAVAALHQTLLPDRKAQVRLTSEPPGAVVVATGQRPGRERRFTPTTIVIEPNVRQQLTLEMPGYVPNIVAPFAVEAGAVVDHHVVMQRVP